MLNPLDFNRVPVESGVWPQLYRGKMKDREELLRHLDAAVLLRSEGAISGVMLHGFPRELERAAAGLVVACAQRSLPLAFSWGLDGSKDNDGSRLTAAEKGECMGRVLGAFPSCRMGGLNPETQWDTDTGPDDDMDEAGAIAMVGALRERAPNAVLTIQPWPAIEQHGDVRRAPKPYDKGGVFAGFPIDEWAKECAFFADQRYWENWPKNPKRYSWLNTWAEREWANVDAALETVAMRRPRTLTIQGYGHNEQPWTVVDAVLSRRDRPVIVWSEPFPDATTIRALRVGPALTSRGFLSPSVKHTDAIRAFQRAAKITADGLAGHDTMRALGLA